MAEPRNTDGFQISNLEIFRANGDRLLTFSAVVRPGEILSVMGPSGIGKSTLLAALTGNLPPEFHCSGSVFLNGRNLMNVKPEHRRLGILFQDHLLFPHMSVADNLAFGLEPQLKNRRARVEDALGSIDLDGFGDRDPASLSGGQRARVALMRMLLSGPEALLLDEAFSRLDRDLRIKMRTLVFERARFAKLPLIMVTHDQEDADAAGGEVINLAHL